jgi:hypothetical protein
MPGGAAGQNRPMDRSTLRADVRTPALAALLLAFVTSASSQGTDGLRPLPGQTRVEIPNCTSGAAIELQFGSDSMLLDGADQAAIGAAMLARYPMLGRDGFAPAAIVLWRKPGADWLYVTLARAASGTSESSAWCVSASFVAAPFEATAGLLRKYFFAGAART